ncbi:MAG: hypothetical protein RLZ37_443 [Actinomycetota bacterium]
MHVMNSQFTTPTSGDIERMTAPILAVPLGSWEQHGPHLPLDTDTRIAEALVARLAAANPDIVRGPTIAVSSSGEHAGFAGTLSIGGRVVVDMMVELVRSAEWAAGVLIVNGHGGNTEYLEQARDRLMGEHHLVLVWSPPLVDPNDSHAGYVETSVMLALEPLSVRVEEIRCAPAPHLADILPDLRATGVKGVSPSGVLGDPRRADADLGRLLLSTWENDLVEAVSRWRSERSTSRRPES